MNKAKSTRRGAPAQVQTPRHQAVTPELRTWIIAQAEAGCDPKAVLAAMRSSGWDEAVAIVAMEETLDRHLAERQRALLPSPPMPAPRLDGSPSQVWAHDRMVRVLLSMQLPRVVLFGDFLSGAECDELMGLAQARLARSETVVNATGGSEINTARTSDGMFFGRGENALCERIEQRIAALVHWPVENGEGLQVLRYRPGAEYKAHHDYFDPNQPGASTILSRGGQRVGTLVVYLNTPEQGGGTTFPDVGLEVAPIKGNALFFSYDRPDAATRSLHAGAPVLQGEKWVATKWMRERRFI